jgi:hypothetical protein
MGEVAKHYNVLQNGGNLFPAPADDPDGTGHVASVGFGALRVGGYFFRPRFLRTIHFIIAWALVLFVVIHVFEVIVSGFWKNVRSIVTGYYRISAEADHE